jgi:hypothetical protein
MPRRSLQTRLPAHNAKFSPSLAPPWERGRLARTSSTAMPVRVVRPRCGRDARAPRRRVTPMSDPDTQTLALHSYSMMFAHDSASRTSLGFMIILGQERRIAQDEAAIPVRQIATASSQPASPSPTLPSSPWASLGTRTGAAARQTRCKISVDRVRDGVARA